MEQRKQAAAKDEEAIDELSGAGPTVVVSVGDVALPDHVTPEDAGLPRHPISAIRGGDACQNAVALRRLLGGEKGAYRDAVLLNAAAALAVYDAPGAPVEDALAAGLEKAREAVDSGAAKAALDRWVAATTA